MHVEADLRVEESLKRINDVKKQVEDYQSMYMTQLYEINRLVRNPI